MRRFLYVLFAVAVTLFSLQVDAIPYAGWVDQETGHRVLRISDEPHSSLPYFTANAVSADERFMVITSPRGIHLLDLNDFSSTLLVETGRRTLWFIGAARTSNKIFYLSRNASSELSSLESVDIYSKHVTVHARLPPSYRVESINANDTLAAGVFEEDQPASSPAPIYKKRGEVLYGRFNEKKRMALFTVELRSGVVRNLYESTEWLSHPQFSPTDPDLLMYSLEGPWHLVDRIWLIGVDGSNRRLIHPRTMEMEITGHEFWSKDGTKVFYDWQFPKGSAFFIASYDVSWYREWTNDVELYDHRQPTRS